MPKFPDMTITSLETIEAYHLDGSYWFTMDELQDATLSQTQEKQDITGKGGRKLNSLKRNKAATVSGTNGLISAGLLEVQTGAAFEHNESAIVDWYDYKTVDGSNGSETDFKAVGTTGAEIKALYIKNPDGTLGDMLEQAESPESGKFKYDPDTKKLTFHTDVEEGTEIAIHYDRAVAGDVLTNQSDVYSDKAKLYINGFCEDKCGNNYRIQIYFPKADFNGDFDLEMGGDQVVHAFEAEALSGSCGLGGALWTYTVFGANATDTNP